MSYIYTPKYIGDCVFPLTLRQTDVLTIATGIEIHELLCLKHYMLYFCFKYVFFWGIFYFHSKHIFHGEKMTHFPKIPKHTHSEAYIGTFCLCQNLG